MNIKKTLALVLCALLLLALLPACESLPPVSSDTPATAEPEGYELAVSLGAEPESLDPAYVSSEADKSLSGHLFEGLMKWYDINGKGFASLTPGQAQSYTMTEGKNGEVTYTFKLRDDIKWSDGRDVTASDFVYSWQRLASPDTEAPASELLSCVLGYEQIKSGDLEPSTLAVFAPDEKTFEVTLSKDVPYFLELCADTATCPVRKDIIEKDPSGWSLNGDSFVGNGAYTLSSVTGESLTATASESYYDAAKLGPDSISFRFYADAAARLEAFEKGEVKAIADPPAEKLRGIENLGTQNAAEGFGTGCVCFNIAAEPFNNAGVREAFSLAIDRNRLISELLNAAYTPAAALVPNGINDDGSNDFGFRHNGGDYFGVAPEDYASECETARRLLSDAGYPEGEGLPTVELSYLEDSDEKAVAEALQGMWQEELGARVTLRALEPVDYARSLDTGDFALVLSEQQPAYSDPMSLLEKWTTDANPMGYSRPEYDLLIEDANAAKDISLRMQLLHEAEDILIGEDSALAPVYFCRSTFMLDPSVRSFFSSARGQLFFMYCSE